MTFLSKAEELRTFSEPIAVHKKDRIQKSQKQIKKRGSHKEAEFFDEIQTKIFFLLAIHSHLYTVRTALA
jgi:hypothetical protein